MAVPVIVGALGRIPVGALTDRYGGRVMFPACALIYSFSTPSQPLRTRTRAA